MKELFSRFRRKLMLEAVCKSVLMGLLIGAVAELTFLVVMHLISRNPGWILIGCVFAIPFLLTFAILFGVVYYPTQKRIARRIDQSGLKERAGTMLEFKDAHSTIIEMQRADAVQRIHNMDLKHIPFRIPRKIVIACVIAAALSVGSMFVPYNIMSMLLAEASPVNKAEEAMIRTLLEALRHETAEADVADSLKTQLYDGFDILEEGLKRAEGELEKAIEIAEEEARVKDTLCGEVSKDQIGAALQQFGATTELGKAIENIDTENASAAMEKMKTQTLAMDADKQADRLLKLSSYIEKALSASGVPESDSLYSALNDFAMELSASSRKDNSTDLEEIVKKSAGEINSVLDEQKNPNDLLNKLLELLGDAKKSILNADFPVWETEIVPNDHTGETADPTQDPAETEEPEETKNPDSESTDRENSDSDSDQDQDSDSGTDEEDPTQTGSSSEGKLNSMREEIYDPSLGNVEYGQVFAAYYADYLASVNEGKIVEDMQEMLEKYFESLNN